MPRPRNRTQEEREYEILECNGHFPTSSGIKGPDAISPYLPSFDPVRQNILCTMHILCNLIKDLYNLFGNESNKTMTTTRLSLEHRYRRFAEAKSASDPFPFHLPWHLKKNLGHNVKPLISRREGFFKNPFTDSHIKSSEWLLLQGDGDTLSSTSFEFFSGSCSAKAVYVDDACYAIYSYT